MARSFEFRAHKITYTQLTLHNRNNRPASGGTGGEIRIHFREYTTMRITKLIADSFGLTASASVGALALALAATPALADAPADDAAASSQIVVTADSTLPFSATPSLDKTGTDLFDLPRSVQIVQKELIDQQGGTMLKDALRNVSGLTQGGQYGFGFYDRFILRGLNVTYLTDGLPDTTSDLTGYTHSLMGVERIEVLKGPGSALFGANEPGGTINIVHARPEDKLFVSASEEYGSFNTSTTNASLNFPLGGGFTARIDGGYRYTDGFRGQKSKIGEVSGTLAYTGGNHEVTARFDYHNIKATPDAVGLPFSPPSGTGYPAAVDVNNRYYTPFAYANQEIKRFALSDTWHLSDIFDLNLRGAYTDRDVDLARNAGGSLTAAGGTYSLTKRQLREQQDYIHDFVFQAEPTWHFKAGNMPVTALIGFEYRNIYSHTARATADLPNIADYKNPVVPETSMAALNFLCDSGHSCNNARLDGRFYAMYSSAQIDVTSKLKLRASIREDFFKTSAEGLSNIPANPGSSHPCKPLAVAACAFIPGQPVVQNDGRFEYDFGATYEIIPQVAVYGGYSRTSYPIFNTEEPQTVGQVPETGAQGEVGLRFREGAWLALNTAIYRTTRNNVFVNAGLDANNQDLFQAYSYAVRGWETDLNLHPIQPWNIIANFALQDPKITSYPQTPANVGKLVPSVPKRIGNVWTSYDFALPDALKLQLAAGLRYRSTFYGDAGMTRILPGAVQVDLSAAITYDKFTLRGGVNNVGDKQVWDYAAGTGSGAMPGPGRTFFVSLSVNKL